MLFKQTLCRVLVINIPLFLGAVRGSANKQQIRHDLKYKPAAINDTEESSCLTNPK
jgi:hypothetical protein